ncbi:MAG: sodium-translocating pyrophosphatase, partial [Candidatus Wolframiiraptor sp.]
MPKHFETLALWGIICVAIAALAYAAMLAREILKEPKSSSSGRMLEAWTAIKDGANAYLRRQFKSISYVIGALAVALYASAHIAGAPLSISLGRAAAFLMGAFFSAAVGFFGMNIAIQGNIRTAINAGKDFRKALRISYRAGTVTG